MLKFLFAVPCMLFLSLIPQDAPPATPEPSPAPAQAPATTNPVTPTPESQAHAKMLYKIDCEMCHGANGNGKGDVVADMHLTLKDFTDPAALKDVPDSEMFNIIRNGKGKMPAEGDRAKDADVWNLVILLRSFSKQ